MYIYLPGASDVGTIRLLLLLNVSHELSVGFYDILVVDLNPDFFERKGT